MYTCKKCQDTGYINISETCTACAGQGGEWIGSYSTGYAVDCNKCSGKGIIETKTKCLECNIWMVK